MSPITRPIPEHLKEKFRDTSIDPNMLASLRNELHAWAFDDVRDVDSIYSAKHTNRQDEIFEPLPVMAKIVGDPELTGMLERCAGRQQRDQVSNLTDHPSALLREAAENLVQRGFEKFTIAHFQLEDQDGGRHRVDARERFGSAKEPMPPNVLSRIQVGVVDSNFVPNGVRALYRAVMGPRLATATENDFIACNEERQRQQTEWPGTRRTVLEPDEPRRLINGLNRPIGAGRPARSCGHRVAFRFDQTCF